MYTILLIASFFLRSFLYIWICSFLIIYVFFLFNMRRVASPPSPTFVFVVLRFDSFYGFIAPLYAFTVIWRGIS